MIISGTSSRPVYLLAIVMVFSFCLTACEDENDPGLNTAPIIQNVSLDKDTVIIGETVQVTVTAEVPDGDSGDLSYLWTATAGTFLDNRAQSTEYIPAADSSGEQTITITVEDSYGETAKKSVAIMVVASEGETDNDGSTADSGSEEETDNETSAADSGSTPSVDDGCYSWDTAVSQQLDFESQYYNFDSGEVSESDFMMFESEDAGWDLQVVYNSDRSYHSVLFQNQSNKVEIAHLADRSFDGIRSCDIENAAFTTDLVDVSFDPQRVVLIRTDQGAVYKLGNANESAYQNGLDFDYAQFQNGSDCYSWDTAVSQQLDFESQYFNLDSGEVSESDFMMFEPEDAGWDFQVVYNSDRSYHSVLFQNQSTGVEIAHLADHDFEDTTACDVESATFTTDLIDVSFDPQRVVLIRTDQGEVYKLGNANESASQNGLSFAYAKLK